MRHAEHRKPRSSWQKRRGARALLFLSVFCFILSSLTSILILCLDQLIFCGALFWGGMVFGILFYVLACLSLRDRSLIHSVSKRPGMFRFFSNRIAIVTDTLMIVSLGATILLGVRPGGNQSVEAVFLFLLILCFYLHCVVNGRLYSCISGRERAARGSSSDTARADARSDR